MADPNDGGILMQYAKLVWENHHDKDRKMVYFECAVQPTPQDRYITTTKLPISLKRKCGMATVFSKAKNNTC